jgi:hypothetical protein
MEKLNICFVKTAKFGRQDCAVGVPNIIRTGHLGNHFPFPAGARQFLPEVYRQPLRQIQRSIHWPPEVFLRG